MIGRSCFFYLYIFISSLETLVTDSKRNDKEDIMITYLIDKIIKMVFSSLDKSILQNTCCQDNVGDTCRNILQKYKVYIVTVLTHKAQYCNIVHKINRLEQLAIWKKIKNSSPYTKINL